MRSFLRSLIFSRPTAILTRPSVIPAALRASGLTRQCVVVAGLVIVVRVSPKFAVMEQSLVWLMSLKAAFLPPLRTKETIAPPAFY